MLNYPVQNLGRAFYHLGHVAGTGPGLIALRGSGCFRFLAKRDARVDIYVEGN